MIDSLDSLVGIMKQDGATRIFVKKLSPNDNSKNQIYLGGDFSALNIIPHGTVKTDSKLQAGSVRDRAKAEVRFSWIDNGGKFRAPSAQLILYPKYPEIRLSGILKGCQAAPSDVIRGRDEGRLLFIGVKSNGEILGYAVTAQNPIAHEFNEQPSLNQLGVFLELPSAHGVSSRDQLISALTTIHRKNWIASQKMERDGIPRPYSARNGGGYTLEAELGISPNGNSAPDFLGWEIKQYGVKDFVRFSASSNVTLLTPEPTGGVYQNEGFQSFMARYGYPDQSGIKERINFGGIYTCNKSAHSKTGLKLRMQGYDEEAGKITDFEGGVALLDKTENVAAFWTFTGIIEHWNRKHAQAAYVPSLFRDPPPEYRFGHRILLCEGTDLNLFLGAIAKGRIFLDPALKIVRSASGELVSKKRNQFRVRHSDLTTIYHRSEILSLASEPK